MLYTCPVRENSSRYKSICNGTSPEAWGWLSPYKVNGGFLPVGRQESYHQRRPLANGVKEQSSLTGFAVNGVSFRVIDIGLTSFKEAYGLQLELLKSRQFNEISDTLLLTEHLHVFTIGRLGLKSNLLIDSIKLKALRIPVYEIDRGGDITYHGPGQLVAYPIFSLKSRNLKIVDYLRSLEESTIKFFHCYGINAERKKGFTGVWFKDEKIASIGIGIKKWVTYHGIGININTDIDYFKLINPCGIKGIRMSSLSKLLGREIEVGAVKDSFVDSFVEVFN